MTKEEAAIGLAEMAVRLNIRESTLRRWMGKYKFPEAVEMQDSEGNTVWMWDEEGAKKMAEKVYVKTLPNRPPATFLKDVFSKDKANRREDAEEVEDDTDLPEDEEEEPEGYVVPDPKFLPASKEELLKAMDEASVRLLPSHISRAPMETRDRIKDLIKNGYYPVSFLMGAVWKAVDPIIVGKAMDDALQPVSRVGKYKFYKKSDMADWFLKQKGEFPSTSPWHYSEYAKFPLPMPLAEAMESAMHNTTQKGLLRGMVEDGGRTRAMLEEQLGISSGIFANWMEDYAKENDAKHETVVLCERVNGHYVGYRAPVVKYFVDRANKHKRIHRRVVMTKVMPKSLGYTGRASVPPLVPKKKASSLRTAGVLFGKQLVEASKSDNPDDLRELVGGLLEVIKLNGAL